MSDPVYLTKEGKEEMQRELDQLKNVRVPELAMKLKEAVAQGDLKENADYHDAREQKALVEGRIQYLENILRSAQLIETDGPTDVVRVGCEVTIREVDGEEDETYMIVGAAEANPREGKISHESPIGSALMNRKKGDKIKVKTPSGEIAFKIKAIK